MQNYIGTIVKKIRTQNKLTQKELAQDICTIRQLSRIESNHNNPSTFILSNFSKRLGIDLFNFIPYSCEQYGYEIKKDLDDVYFLYNNHHYEDALSNIKQLIEMNYVTNKTVLQEILWLESSSQLHILKKHNSVLQTKLIELLKLTKTFSSTDELFDNSLTRIECEIISTLIYNFLIKNELVTAKTWLLKLIKNAEIQKGSESNTSYLRALINISKIYFEEQDFQKALVYSKKGIDYCHKNNSLYLLDILSNLYGRALYKTGEIKKGQRFIMQYILLSQRRNNSSVLNSIYEQLWVNYNLDQFELITPLLGKNIKPE